MAKNKRRKSEKKRNLKYGHITISKEKNQIESDTKGGATKISGKNIQSKENDDFKKELRKNLTFVGVFLAFLLALYFALTYTNLFNSILNSFGLNGVYKK